jgi:hypothetical protein
MRSHLTVKSIISITFNKYTEIIFSLEIDQMALCIVYFSVFKFLYNLIFYIFYSIIWKKIIAKISNKLHNFYRYFTIFLVDIMELLSLMFPFFRLD